MFVDMANNTLTLLDTVIVPTLRNTIYQHMGNIMAMRWYFDENGTEKQRVKIAFPDGKEKWYEADRVVRFNEA